MAPEAGPARAKDALTIEEKARQTLEDDIVRYSNAIINAKYRLNALTRVARLPPELLTEVFIYYRDAFAYDADPLPSPRSVAVYGNSRTASPYHWLRITHVCRHWRELALGSPRFWSTIYLTHRSSCIDEMLARARQAPLTIRSTNVQVSEDIVKHVLQHLHRIVTFDLRLPPVLTELGDSVPAPLLQNLVIRSNGGYRDMFPSGSANLLQRFFTACELPNLKSLDISGFSIRCWNTALLKSTLTHLRLHGSAVLSTLTFDHVLDSLESMPLLEELDIKDVLPHMSENELPDEVTRVANLPNLRTLKVYNALWCACQLLRSLSFPRSAAITLNCAVSHATGPLRLFNVVFAKLAGSAEPVDGNHFRTVSLQSSLQADGLIFRAWRAFISAGQITSRDKAPAKPDVEVTLRLSGITVSTHSLLDSIPIASAESFQVALHARRAATKRDFIAIFERLPELRELSLDRWSQNNLQRLLEHRVDANTTTKSGRKRKQPCMPKLSVLVLEDMTLGNPHDDDSIPSLLSGIQKALAARKKSKAQLRKLVIRRCTYYSEADEKAVKDVVGTVEWDNYGRFGYGATYGFDDDPDPDDYSTDYFDEDDGFYDGYYDDVFPWDSDEEDFYGPELFPWY